MIALEGRLFNLGNELSERAAKIFRQIEITDRKINDEVYKIYGLTQSEIDSVEATFKQKE